MAQYDDLPTTSLCPPNQHSTAKLEVKGAAAVKYGYVKLIPKRLVLSSDRYTTHHIQARIAKRRFQPNKAKRLSFVF